MAAASSWGGKDILPVCIKAGALDDNVPERDLWISPHHAMYFRRQRRRADRSQGPRQRRLDRAGRARRQGRVFPHRARQPRRDHRRRRAVGDASSTTTAAACSTTRTNTTRSMPTRGRGAGALLRAAARRRLRGRSGAAAHCAARRAAARRRRPRARRAARLCRRVSAQRIAGWAQNADHPEAPVCLDIYAGGRLIGQVLANRYREDLRASRPRQRPPRFRVHACRPGSLRRSRRSRCAARSTALFWRMGRMPMSLKKCKGAHSAPRSSAQPREAPG